MRPTISQEAVSEFQINRNGYNAEFGRASRGIINIVSKSGTNQFHGNVYNYFRNERLDARNTFAAGQQQDPPFKRNQPGFTIGGPIRKDRTFFFAAYEGLIRRESAITTILSDPSILQPTAGQQDLINTLIGSGFARFSPRKGNNFRRCSPLRRTVRSLCQTADRSRSFPPTATHSTAQCFERGIPDATERQHGQPPDRSRFKRTGFPLLQI